MSELPRWVQEFNAQGLAAKYLSATWDLLLPRERYHQVLPDDNPYEEPLMGATAATLPQDLGALFEAGARNTALLRWVPGSNTITTDFARAALKAEQLGMELERLFNALDEQVGKGLYTVFLTADHAAVDVPEYLKDRKASAGYVDMQALVTLVEATLSARYGEGKWVRKRIKEQLFLNDSLIAARKLDPSILQRVAADALLTEPNIAEALTAADLVRTTYPTGIRNKVQRGFMPLRSGDVCFVLRPSYLASWPGMVKQGTEHGSPWNYDTHVPILFFGQGVVKGEVLRHISITDIAPTIAMLVGMTMPDASTGEVVPEVIRP
jgi:hypothetical protein